MRLTVDLDEHDMELILAAAVNYPMPKHLLLTIQACVPELASKFRIKAFTKRELIKYNLGPSRAFDFDRNDQPRVPRRKAFTLIELLVCIVIISLLLSLLLPAIQSARATTRGIQCMNNLYQVGIEMADHLTTHKTLPHLSLTTAHHHCPYPENELENATRAPLATRYRQQYAGYSLPRIAGTEITCSLIWVAHCPSPPADHQPECLALFLDGHVEGILLP